MSESRSYARTRVAVAPGDSASSLKKSATATRRWTKEEMLARVAAAPEFPHPSPIPSQLDDIVRGYEQITGDLVRRQAKRNLIAACARVHGDDFLPLVRETFVRTGTATNLLGGLRVRPLGSQVDAVPGDSATQATRQADATSAWCGCPEEELRPGVLYCASHRPAYLSAPRFRFDRRSSNPAAASFYASVGRSASETPWP
jgi:hypothetical protein